MLSLSGKLSPTTTLAGKSLTTLPWRGCHYVFVNIICLSREKGLTALPWKGCHYVFVNIPCLSRKKV
jgi:hypothetical protein